MNIMHPCMPAGASLNRHDPRTHPTPTCAFSAARVSYRASELNDITLFTKVSGFGLPYSTCTGTANKRVMKAAGNRFFSRLH